LLEIGECGMVGNYVWISVVDQNKKIKGIKTIQLLTLEQKYFNFENVWSTNAGDITGALFLPLSVFAYGNGKLTYLNKSDINYLTVESDKFASKKDLALRADNTYSIILNIDDGTNKTNLSFIATVLTTTTLKPLKNPNVRGATMTGINFNKSKKTVAQLPYSVFPGNSQINVENSNAVDYNVELEYVFDANINFINQPKSLKTSNQVLDIKQVENWLVTFTKNSKTHQFNFYNCETELTQTKLVNCHYWKSNTYSLGPIAKWGIYTFNSEIYLTVMNTQIATDATYDVKVYKIANNDGALPDPTLGDGRGLSVPLPDQFSEFTLLSLFQNVVIAILNPAAKKVYFAQLSFWGDKDTLTMIDDNLSLKGQNIPDSTKWCPVKILSNPYYSYNSLDILSFCMNATPAENQNYIYKFDLTSIAFNDKEALIWKLLDLNSFMNINDT